MDHWVGDRRSLPRDRDRQPTILRAHRRDRVALAHGLPNGHGTLLSGAGHKISDIRPYNAQNSACQENCGDRELFRRRR